MSKLKKTSPVKKQSARKAARWTLPVFSQQARLIIFVLLFANIATIGMLVARAATAGLTYSNESDQFTRINNYRTANGRAALKRSACITGIARDYAKRMGDRGVLKHSSDTASGFYSSSFDYGKQIPAQCAGGWRKLAENVGVGYDSPSLFNAFVGSAAHRANLMDAAHDFSGIGAYRSADGRLWVVQLFADCPGCGSPYTTAPRSSGEPGSNLNPTMVAGNKLTAGQSKYSMNGSYRLTMQSDGNMVLYKHWGGYTWTSRSAGSSNAYAIFQSDGNFVLYRTGKNPCHSGTGGRGGKSISVGGDGNLVIYSGTGSAIWQSRSSTWYCS